MAAAVKQQRHLCPVAMLILAIPADQHQAGVALHAVHAHAQGVSRALHSPPRSPPHTHTEAVLRAGTAAVAVKC